MKHYIVLFILLITLSSLSIAASDDKSSTQTITSFYPVPVQMELWTRKPPIRFFSPDTLWEYINGKADDERVLQVGFLNANRLPP